MVNKPSGTVIDCLRDPLIFGRQFSDKSWRSWKIFLRALFGLKMGPKSRAVFHQHTQRKTRPKSVTEAWAIVGRRGGKSLVAALTVIYLSCFRDYSQLLGPGERGTVMVIAADRRQARVIMRYVIGLLESVPMLSTLIEAKRSESIDLRNRITIEIHTCNFRTVRGYSIVACVCDEIAFWRSEESASPDSEVLAAIRPGLANIPNSLLLCISSPYSRKGELWKAHQKYYGTENDNVLVWQASTREMNSTIPQSLIDQALADDEASASAEFMGQFRTDIEGYILLEALQKITIPSRLELLPNAQVRYCAFVDPSGGSRDSMTLAIAHKEKDKIVIDCLREAKAPFSPEAVTQEFAQVCKSYRVRQVTGDRYAGDWPREQFRKRGIRYLPCDMSKSVLYQALLPVINSGQVELLDNGRLRQQLLGLERRTGHSGRDSIDHSPGSHDDLSNVVAGVVGTISKASGMSRSYTWPNSRQSKREKTEILHIVKWNDLEAIPDDQAFTLNCYFCNETLRTYPTYPGTTITPDDDCNMCGTTQSETWFIGCKGCVARMKTESPRKLKAEGRRRRESSLLEAAKAGRAEIHDFGILTGGK